MTLGSKAAARQRGQVRNATDRGHVVGRAFTANAVRWSLFFTAVTVVAGLANAAGTALQNVTPVGPADRLPIAILVGCLERDSSTREKDDQTFTLTNVRPSTAMLTEPIAVTTARATPDGSAGIAIEQGRGYRIVGSQPDLHRHVGEEVEVIVVTDALNTTDVSLQMQSIRRVAPSCSMKPAPP